MRQTKSHLRGKCLWVIASACLVVAAASVNAAGAATTATYYQVTYADGGVKDLPEPPDTKEGITRVVRITRKSPPQTGYEITATGPDVLTVINPETIARQQMRWNGKKWIVPGKKRRPAGPERAAAPREVEIRRLRHIVRGLALLVNERAAEADKAEKELAGAVGKPGEEEARLKLAEARRNLEECKLLLAEHEAILDMAEDRPADRQGASPAGPQGPAEERAGEIRRLEAALHHLRQRLLFFDMAAVETEGSLFEEAGTSDATDTRWELEAINKIRGRLRQQIEAYENRLAELKAAAARAKDGQ